MSSEYSGNIRGYRIKCDMTVNICGMTVKLWQYDRKNNFYGYTARLFIKENAKNMKDQILKQINESIETKKSLDISAIENSAKMLAECLRSGNKILLCGNGGSAADCQHIAAELVIRFRSSIVRPALPAIALTCDTSILTAGGNDIGFDNIFAQQVAALGTAGDILVGISTSGNSANVINAFNVAKEKNMQTIGLLGMTGGKMLALCDISLVVEHKETARIQESHLLIEHIWCDLIERILFPEQF